MSLNEILKLRQFNALSVCVEEGNVLIQGELQEIDKTCPACGKEALKPHQYYEKRVRHLSFGGFPTYLVFERKDWICECGKVFLERLEFQDLHSKYTKPYEEYIAELAKKQDMKRVAELEKLSWDIAEAIFKKNRRTKTSSAASQRSNGKNLPSYR
jgi:transposase